MRLFFLSAVAISLAGQVYGQASPCEVGCVDGVFAAGTELGCAAGDSLCMCGKTSDLENGIRDCVIDACSGDEAQVIIALDISDGRCAAASSSAGLEPTTTPSTPTTTAAPTTTAPETTVPETTVPETTASETTASETSTSSAPTETPVSQTVASSTPAASSVAAPSGTVSTTPSSSPSPTEGLSAPGDDDGDDETPDESTAESDGSAPEESSEEQSEDNASSGLSTAAKAGIGAGAGVAVIMAGIIAVCMVMRRKEREKDARRARNLDISQPLPGAGRMYAEESKTRDFRFPVASVVSPPPRYSPNSRNTPTALSGRTAGRNSYSSELDRRARPYEEMMQGTQPRTMI